MCSADAPDPPKRDETNTKQDRLTIAQKEQRGKERSTEQKSGKSALTIALNGSGPKIDNKSSSSSSNEGGGLNS